MITLRDPLLESVSSPPEVCGRPRLYWRDPSTRDLLTVAGTTTPSTLSAYTRHLELDALIRELKATEAERAALLIARHTEAAR